MENKGLARFVRSNNLLHGRLAIDLWVASMATLVLSVLAVIASAPFCLTCLSTKAGLGLLVMALFLDNKYSVYRSRVREQSDDVNVE